ncbi:hypothetical protein BDV09DRAFT_40027 [Aspergillus tetrazonus]
MGSARPNTLVIPWGGAENIYRRVGLSFKHLNREHWRIHCVCTISFINTRPEERATSLRDAWKILVTEYPRLAVIPNGTTSKIYQILETEADVENWAQETFFIERERSSDNIIRTTEPRDLPSLHFIPSTSQIILLASHWRMDAIGCMMLLDRLFSLVPLQGPNSKTAIGTREEQVARISPSLEDAANCPPSDSSPSSSELKTYAESWIDTMHKKAINACGLPYKGENTTPPRETTHQDLTFTSTATSFFVSSCKERGISVSAAIHTALARTIFSFSPEGEGTGYTTVMAVNLRPYLPGPYNGAGHAVQTYVASIIPTVPRDEEFTESARKLTKTYKGWYSDKFMRSLRWIYAIHAERLFNTPQLPRGANVPPPKPPSGVTLSSLGVVSSYLKNGYGDDGAGKGVKVERFRFGVTMMTRQMLLYVWTFREKLTLSVCYNEAYYEDNVARAVLDSLKGVLEEELGIELEVQ